MSELKHIGNTSLISTFGSTSSIKTAIKEVTRAFQGLRADLQALKGVDVKSQQAGPYSKSALQVTLPPGQVHVFSGYRTGFAKGRAEPQLLLDVHTHDPRTGMRYIHTISNIPPSASPSPSLPFLPPPPYSAKPPAPFEPPPPPYSERPPAPFEPPPPYSERPPAPFEPPPPYSERPPVPFEPPPPYSERPPASFSPPAPQAGRPSPRPLDSSASYPPASQTGPAVDNAGPPINQARPLSSSPLSQDSAAQADLPSTNPFKRDSAVQADFLPTNPYSAAAQAGTIPTNPYSAALQAGYPSTNPFKRDSAAQAGRISTNPFNKDSSAANINNARLPPAFRQSGPVSKSSRPPQKPGTVPNSLSVGAVSTSEPFEFPSVTQHMYFNQQLSASQRPAIDISQNGIDNDSSAHQPTIKKEIDKPDEKGRNTSSDMPKNELSKTAGEMSSSYKELNKKTSDNAEVANNISYQAKTIYALNKEIDACIERPTVNNLENISKIYEEFNYKLKSNAFSEKDEVYIKYMLTKAYEFGELDYDKNKKTKENQEGEEYDKLHKEYENIKNIFTNVNTNLVAKSAKMKNKDEMRNFLMRYGNSTAFYARKDSIKISFAEKVKGWESDSKNTFKESMPEETKKDIEKKWKEEFNKKWSGKSKEDMEKTWRKDFDKDNVGKSTSNLDTKWLQELNVRWDKKWNGELNGKWDEKWEKEVKKEFDENVDDKLRYEFASQYLPEDVKRKGIFLEEYLSTYHAEK